MVAIMNRVSQAREVQQLPLSRGGREYPVDRYNTPEYRGCVTKLGSPEEVINVEDSPIEFKSEEITYVGHVEDPGYQLPDAMTAIDAKKEVYLKQRNVS